MSLFASIILKALASTVPDKDTEEELLETQKYVHFETYK